EGLANRLQSKTNSSRSRCKPLWCYLMRAMLMSMSQAKRRYPIGAELIGENQTHFRVWAPKTREVDVVFEDAAESKPKFCSLTAEPGGYFSGTAHAGPGTRYRFRVNRAENVY